MNTIDKFLENWEKSVTSYYLELFNQYKGLISTKNQLKEKYNITIGHPIKNGTETKYTVFTNGCSNNDKRNASDLPNDLVKCSENIETFFLTNTKNDISVVDEINRFGEERLKEILRKEVVHKKAALIKRIEKKAGKFRTAEYLTIGIDGNLNGHVNGEKAKVAVETILAGGYNVQKLHYRVLVK